MDWLKNSLATAQKQAQEAAEKARVLAAQASVQARDYAGKASERAKDLAKIAADEAQQRILQLSSAAQQQMQTRPGHSQEELHAYGITEELREFISSLTYSTFSDYPLDSLPPSSCIPGTTNVEEFKLNAWQQQHAVLLLDTVHQLHDLRFVLCPRRMSEARFWVIYFTMVKRLLPAEAFADNPQLPTVPQPAAPTERSLPTTPAAAAAAFQAAAANAFAAVSSYSLGRKATPTPPPATATASSLPATAPVSSTDAERSSITSQHQAGKQHTETTNRHSSAASHHTSEVLVEHPGGGAEEEDLEHDPELEAYLQEALQIDKDADDGEGDASDVGDLDEYLNQLDAELGDDDVGLSDEVEGKGS